ncbi:MAG: AAA family ATPase [Pseudomonadota bacterium]
MIEHLQIEGYRSIRSLHLDLSPLTVVLGANGVGKTNIYRGLELLHGASTGQLSRMIAAEGGLSSVFWAGQAWREASEQATHARARRQGQGRTLKLAVTSDGTTYGMRVNGPNPISDAALPNDACIREETLTFLTRGRSVKLMDRKGPACFVRNQDGRMQEALSDLLLSETALSRSAERAEAPAVITMQRMLARARFYHQFRTDVGSPLRQRRPDLCTTELSSDGEDWAATLATVMLLAEDVALQEAVNDAFPGSSLVLDEERGVSLQMPEFYRPFAAAELSDGLLRYLCLIAALRSHRPPEFIALNEPETSLNGDLIDPLARLIGEAAQRTQILVVTHSERLAEMLDLDFAADIVRLEKQQGETRII